MSDKNKIFIIAGESSGDTRAAELIHDIKSKDNSIQYFGVGGSKLEAEGVNLIYKYNEINFIGFT